MTHKEFMDKWAVPALDSQSACNPSGLLHSALVCLGEWRYGELGKWDGSDCIPFKFMIHQVSYLCGNVSTEYGKDALAYHRDSEALRKR